MTAKTCFSGGSVAVIALKQLLVNSPPHVCIGRSTDPKSASAGPNEPLRKTSARVYSERVVGPGVGDGTAAWGGLEDGRDPINGSDRKFIVLRTINTIKNRTTAPPTYR